MNGHVLLCNTINFLAHIKVSEFYPIAYFTNIYGMLYNINGFTVPKIFKYLTLCHV